MNHGESRVVFCYLFIRVVLKILIGIGYYVSIGKKLVKKNIILV